MFLRFAENPNCAFSDDRVFTERSTSQVVTQVLRRPVGEERWCDVVAINEKGVVSAAYGCKVEDSGEGLCYLVYGQLWGLRLKPPSCQDPWSLDDPHQWGEAFLLLPADGKDLRFES